MDITLYFERIEQYVSGDMTADARAAFEAELTQNNDLRQALALYRQSNEVVEQGIENNLRQQLQQWAAAEQQPPLTVVHGPAKSKIWTRLAIAASVALLLGWFGWQWAGSAPSSQELYASYYEKPADSNFRSGGTAHPLQPGFDALQAENFTAATAFFSTIAPGDERYFEAQYYLGHVYLLSRDYPKAITAFTACANSGEAKFAEKAAWNLALTYLAAGNTEAPAFNTLLEKMATDTNHSFHDKAKKLQEDLR
jgi:hypothetical protein